MQNPTYTILTQEGGVADNMNGQFFTIVLTPDIDPAILPEGTQNSDYAETQKYFVADGMQNDVVLSAAAWNHQNELEKRFLPVTENVVIDPKPVIAIPVDKLPEDVQESLNA